MELEARIATLRMAETFVICRGATDEADVVVVELSHDSFSSGPRSCPIDDNSAERTRSVAAPARSRGDAGP